MPKRKFVADRGLHITAFGKFDPRITVAFHRTRYPIAVDIAGNLPRKVYLGVENNGCPRRHAAPKGAKLIVDVKVINKTKIKDHVKTGKGEIAYIGVNKADGAKLMLRRHARSSCVYCCHLEAHSLCPKGELAVARAKVQCSPAWLVPEQPSENQHPGYGVDRCADPRRERAAKPQIRLCI